MVRCLMALLAVLLTFVSSPAGAEEIRIPEHGALFCDKRKNLPEFLKLVLDHNMNGVMKMSDCTLLRSGLRAEVIENEFDASPKTQKVRIFGKGHSTLGYIIKMDP